MQSITACEERQTIKNRRYGIALGILICLAIASMAMAVHRSSHAASPIPIPVSFAGEYSQNGGEWQTLTADTRFNALHGDLVLRGSFDYKKDEVPIHAYLDNISMTVFVNGEEEFSMPNPDPADPDSAGSRWIGWTSHAFAAKTVEIHLSNVHAVGNPNAYNDFINNLYIGPKAAFENYILSPGDYLSRNIKYDSSALLTTFLQSGQFWRGIAFGVFVLTLVFLGIALADSLQSKLFGRRLWLLGALSMFSVGVIVLDTSDVSLWNTGILFNTCGAQLCRMLWMQTLSLFAADMFTGRRRQAALAAALLGGIFDAGAFLLFLLGNTYVTDIFAPWFWLQAVIVLILMPSCALELKNAASRKQGRQPAALLLVLCSVAAELCNARFGFWQRGLLLNRIIVLLLLICGILAVKRVPTAYRAVKEEARLNDELTQNRISIMLSQIQPHFLYGCRQLFDFGDLFSFFNKGGDNGLLKLAFSAITSLPSLTLSAAGALILPKA